MNKKNLIVLIAILLIGVICLTMTRSHEKKKDNIVDCDVFKNNAYKIIFHSEGGPDVDTVEICDTCKRSEDNSLPVIAKKGYNFEGWYYDSLFLMKADVKTIDELEITIRKDDEGCDYEYKDINLYALWTKK